LDGERFTTAAGVLRVRVIEDAALAVEAVLEIEDDAFKVDDRLRIDEDLDSVEVQDIVLFLLISEFDLIGKTRTATT
jgi:hypothetical protein